MNVVKNVDATSGLIGKIAGLHIQSSSEFNEAPTMSLRGESPLLVIDGVPYTNISLRDIAPDDIESINVLKGATASALYGSRGGSGAVIVTTKKGNKKGGLEVAVNSNTMFEAGYLALPKVQKSYSSGGAGKYGSGDFVWGDKLDIGRTALQYDPYTYEWGEAPLVSKGKDNLTNFLEPGFITNNNIGISHQGEKGSFRSSLTHVYNKGQYPGSKLNKLTYTVGGDMKVDKFTFEGNMTYNKRFYPNNSGTGYGSGGYIYNLLVWSGPEFDIRDYKNYWVKGKEGIQQNWMDNNWYDNPYFIANEKRHSNDYDVTNGFMSMKYDVKPWLNFTLRSGFDYYSDKEEWKYAKSLISNKKGYYKMDQETAFSSNTDLIIMGNHKIGKLGIDALIGSTLYYRQGSNVWGETKNGLSIPGFYSINASVDPATTGQGGSKKQVNSIFGKATLSWDNMFYVDITARNDWSSTLPSSTRSYFYPSISSSLILSEIFEKPQWLDLWKLRGSWTKTKNDIGVYETNNTYSMSTNIWDGLNAAYYPGSIRGFALRPESSRSYEIGTAANFLKNRLWLDLTYYNKLRYDFATRAPLSEASSFSSIYLNTDEQLEHKGVEVTIGGKIMKNDSFSWNTLFNWALDRQVYKKLDEKYSSKYPWAGVGERTDVATTSHYIWDTDSKGNIVHGSNGLPINIRKIGKMGYSSPDWVWGFTNSFQYKHFMLDITFDGSVGGVAYNRTEQAMWNSGSHIESDNKWRYDQVVNGLNNYIGKGVQVVSGTIERDEYGQVISDNRTYAPNDKEVSYENYIRQYQGDSYESAPQNFFSKSFFKLREVAISYNVPTTFAKKLGVNDFRIAAVGNNLFLWTKEFKYSDPDKGSDNLNSPSMRYLGFNFRFSF
ncbi:SusC/RagA family TonB-linked outer membrane protein [Sphingobacterium sp. ML3W]|uniref:SusC/RagA family TonB-linked outer membrane protein n=1 Tax=Sphingobacterium sp. ML3W TaxID=1538644 RepID=UPI000A8D1343|nr:SusC/RagA family TonB-linked outer membrane protein [Sphingobacterium sp. ML3W]